MTDIRRLARPHLLALKPYTSARDEFSGEAKVSLDANENAFGPVIPGAYHRYPDPHQKALKNRLAALKGVKPEQIFLGNGSDEAIDLLIRAFCDPARDHVIINPPTYGMYQVSAEVNAVRVEPVLLRPDFQLNIPELVAAFRPGSKLVFLCSPNNPSGNCLDEASVRRVLQHAPGLVLLDEAYIDFVPERSLLPLLDEFPNLVVLQTFSKAWGLAGLRLGMAFGHPELIALLDKIKAPYNINQLTQQLAHEALGQEDEKHRLVAEICAQRELLREELADVPGVLHVFPSDANFLLVRVADADRLYAQLLAEGIVVRNRSKGPLCEGCLRLTVGTPEENAQLLAAMRRIGA